jgi:predicted nucleic acid-binding protein
LIRVCPRDDLVLELAVEAQVDAVITYNVRDFEPARTFGLEVLTPQQVLRRLEGQR